MLCKSYLFSIISIMSNDCMGHRIIILLEVTVQVYMMDVLHV